MNRPQRRRESHSMSPRLRSLFETAEWDDGWLNASYSEFSNIFNGMEEFSRLVEGPERDLYYRMESPDGPVMIFEFNDRGERIYMLETDEPESFLGFDPRASIVSEDWDATFDISEDIGSAERALAANPKSKELAARYVSELARAGKTPTRRAKRLANKAKRIFTVILQKLPNMSKYSVEVKDTSTELWGSYKVSAVSPMGSVDFAVSIYFPTATGLASGRVLNIDINKGHASTSFPGGSGVVFKHMVGDKLRNHGIPVPPVLAPPRKNIYENYGRGGDQSYEIDRDRAERRETKLERTNKPTRSSSRRPRKQGEGPSQIYGGFRIHVGKNKNRKPNYDQQRRLQNKRNAKRGLAKRVNAAKKWHRGKDGDQYHKALGRYNDGNHRGESLRHRIADLKERMAQYSGLKESERKNLDEAFEEILRVLIAGEDLDVLQDVEFDDDNGSIYLFFDPSLTQEDTESILAKLKAKQGTMEIIATPVGAESESDWWVLFLPGKEDGVPASPNANIYAPSGEIPGQKQQMFVSSEPTTPEKIAQGVNVTKLLKAMR